MVRNKFHFAITGQTAAEIIFKNANAKKENMGLTTWKNAPEGRILKSDTTTLPFMVVVLQYVLDFSPPRRR